MRHIQQLGLFVLLVLLIACPMPWEEEEEEDQPPEPPTILRHEFSSHQHTNNEHLDITIYFERNGGDFGELQRSAPDDGQPEFQHMANLYESSGQYLDNGHLGRPCWGRRYIYRMGVYADSGELILSDEYVIDTPPFLPPHGVSATLNDEGNTITVSWNGVEIDSVSVSYRVYRAVYTEDPSYLSDSDFEQVDDVSTTSYTDSAVSPGTYYAYRVTTLCDQWGQTPWSAVAVLGSGGGDATVVPPPQGLTAEENTDGDGIVVSWETVTGADGYKVYRATGASDASYAAISDWVEAESSSDAVSYTDTTAIYGTTYYYRVKARANDVESVQSDYAPGILGTAGSPPPKPQNVTAQQHYSGEHIVIEWDEVPGATRYRVYRLASSATANPADIASYTQVHETETGDAAGWDDHRDDSHDVGRLYYYRVGAVTEHGESFSDDRGEGFFGSELAKPDRPPNGSASDGTYSNAIVVTWDAVPAAALYRVYSLGGDSALYIEATEDFAVSDWITDTEFVHMPEAIYNRDVASYKIQARHAWGGVSMLSDGFVGSVDPDAPAYTTGDDGDDDGDTGGSGSWVALGTDDFASTSDELAMATVGSTLYVGFADGSDADNRIRVMQHGGSEGGSWSDAGGYLSLSAAYWNELTLTEIGGALYAAYADTDDSVTSGGSSAVSVKKFDGSSWSTIGDASLGYPPMLAGSGTDLYMVYPGSSSGLLESRKYEGSGTTWSDYDDAYWSSDFDNLVSSFTIALDLDVSDNPVVAVGAGHAPDSSYSQFEFYRNDGGWAPHISSFTPTIGEYALELYGLRYDGGGTPYVAYSNHHESGYQASCGLAKWNGSAWQELDLLAQIGISEGSVHDLAMIPSASGGGVLVAAAYRDGIDLWVELWHYTGSAWQQIGPDISAGTRDPDSYPSLTVAVQYDGNGNPVVVFADDESGSIRARGFRE